jgi:hypothetical protein
MKNNSLSEDVQEELKMLAALHETCVLQFRADNGGVVTLKTVIRDVFEAEGLRLLTENGIIIRQDQLVSVNGKPLEYLC